MHKEWTIATLAETVDVALRTVHSWAEKGLLQTIKPPRGYGHKITISTEGFLQCFLINMMKYANYTMPEIRVFLRRISKEKRCLSDSDWLIMNPATGECSLTGTREFLTDSTPEHRMSEMQWIAFRQGQPSVVFPVWRWKEMIDRAAREAGEIPIFCGNADD